VGVKSADSWHMGIFTRQFCRWEFSASRREKLNAFLSQGFLTMRKHSVRLHRAIRTAALRPIAWRPSGGLPTFGLLGNRLNIALAIIPSTPDRP
jgi:hypothetical protein